MSSSLRWGSKPLESLEPISTRGWTREVLRRVEHEGVSHRWSFKIRSPKTKERLKILKQSQTYLLCACLTNLHSPTCSYLHVWLYDHIHVEFCLLIGGNCGDASILCKLILYDFVVLFRNNHPQRVLEKKQLSEWARYTRHTGRQYNWARKRNLWSRYSNWRCVENTPTWHQGFNQTHRHASTVVKSDVEWSDVLSHCMHHELARCDTEYWTR